MLYDQISKDYVQAMKDKDKDKASTLNFLRAQLKNLMIEKKVETLEDADVIAVIKKQAKQRQDSISQYESGGRPDLANKETAELTILREYLPSELSEDEIIVMVEAAIRENGASSMKDMGGVMKAVLGKAGGRADSKTVSEIVKGKLKG